MFENFRRRLQEGLREGFWFNRFQDALDWIHRKTSLSIQINSWLRENGEAPLGATELYELLLVVLGVIWVSIVTKDTVPFLASPLFRGIGIAIILYFITELFLFSLHWTFVAGKQIESTRRSLGTFIVNLIQIAISFSLISVLSSCQLNPQNPWASVYSHLKAVLSLSLVETSDNLSCRLVAHYELVVSGTIVLIILASLVGAVVRPEKKQV